MSAQPITVRVKTEYLKHQSNPEAKQYVFAYHISVHNQGDAPVQLISRHWIITDSNGLKQEVRGAGVIGKQPTIEHLLDIFSVVTLKESIDPELQGVDPS
ncbi:MAG: ApaG domain [Porticoccaceae bacterium]|nr:ApaG domain [Porticoccaceae bacterium]